MRQVRRKLVVRLEKELTDEHLEELNDSFHDLVGRGKIEKTYAFPEEANEPELLDKPRIAFNNNRKSAARLNQMFLRINELGRSL
jgi:hypothetical protein